MTPTLPAFPAQWGDDEAARERTGPPVPPDPWDRLRTHTPARIALGRSGTSLPTTELLRFAAAHAQARDAVHLPLDVPALVAELRAAGLAVTRVRSQAMDRAHYLARPDLGRRLAPDESQAAAAAAAGPPLCVVIGDGLSATAAQAHAVPLVRALRGCLAPHGIALDEVVVATQARVALGDEIGQRRGAQAVLVLLGERPGLSSPDSLGAYLTFDPRPGRADSERNCVSNIRPAGLAVDAAAARLAWLVRESLRRRLTGIGLKDDSSVSAIASR